MRIRRRRKMRQPESDGKQVASLAGRASQVEVAGTSRSTPPQTAISR